VFALETNKPNVSYFYIYEITESLCINGFKEDACDSLNIISDRFKENKFGLFIKMFEF